MTGTYEHSIDAKSRLFIPAKLREELGSTFYLTMGIDACLAIYPMETWNVFTEKFASLPMSQSKVMRPLFANAVKCEPDAQGRIVLPQRLKSTPHWRRIPSSSVSTTALKSGVPKSGMRKRMK